MVRSLREGRFCQCLGSLDPHGRPRSPLPRGIMYNSLVEQAGRSRRALRVEESPSSTGQGAS